MELIFVRHGQPAWSADGFSQPDPPLTARGHEQASLVAERLADSHLHLTEVLVSPLRRARQTATPLAELAGVPITVVEELEEIHMPDWSGRREEDVQHVFEAARNRPPEEWWHGLDGGESFHDFHDRVSTAILDILAERGVAVHPSGNHHLWEVNGDDRRIAIVAHAGTNTTLLSFLLGIDPTPWEWERFVLGHGSIARLRTLPLAGAHVFSLRAFNDREHLPEGLRTR